MGGLTMAAIGAYDEENQKVNKTQVRPTGGGRVLQRQRPSGFLDLEGGPNLAKNSPGTE